ncbi:hypothetical protein ABXI76_23355 [Streptomyces parvus]
MKSTHLSLIAGAAVLAAVTGFATVTAPGAPAESTAKSATLLPVERAGLVCPAPSNSDLAETQYTAFTPAGTGGDAKGTAELKRRCRSWTTRTRPTRRRPRRPRKRRRRRRRRPRSRSSP